jgi:hypothetical protein
MEKVYVKKNELDFLPLDKDNHYCNPATLVTDSTCHYTFVRFLKEDPITKKINLSLLINYAK